MAVRNWQRFWMRLALDIARARRDDCISEVDALRLEEAERVAREMNVHHGPRRHRQAIDRRAEAGTTRTTEATHG